MVISPELADVLAAVIHRIREPSGAVAAVASYDPHERVWNPPMPLLFQRRFGGGNRAIPSGTIRDWICQAIPEDAAAGDSLTNTAGRPLRFTPHDFRRIFITDAVLHGMPPHIAQLVAGHRDINTTMGYKAVYPEEAINGHRAFVARRRARAPPRNTARPPTTNGRSSSVTSSTARSRWAPADAPTPPPASTSTPACVAHCSDPTPPNATGSSTSATT